MKGADKAYKHLIELARKYSKVNDAMHQNCANSE